jgi:hypothetical protein
LDKFVLFLTHPDGSVYTTSGNAQDGWAPWSRVPESRAVPGSRVTAVSTLFFPGRFALFVTDPGGQVRTTNNIQGFWDSWSSPSEGSSPPGSPITAVSRNLIAAGIALFLADPNGGVYTTSSHLAVPKEPSSLRVTDVGDRKIGLAWQDNSDDESGFEIRFRGKRPDFSDHTGTKSVGRNVVSASLTGLRSNHEYTISVVAVNQGGSSRSSNEVRATTPARQISVSNEGVGPSAVFTVAGTGFSPNSLVIIRVSDAPFQLQDFPETSGADGKFTSRHGLPCVSGVTVWTFTAFEDADPQGTVANTVVTTCP